MHRNRFLQVVVLFVLCTASTNSAAHAQGVATPDGADGETGGLENEPDGPTAEPASARTHAPEPIPEGDYGYTITGRTNDGRPIISLEPPPRWWLNQGIFGGAGYHLSRVHCLSPCGEGEFGAGFNWHLGYHVTRRLAVVYEGSWWNDFEDDAFNEEEMAVQTPQITTHSVGLQAALAPRLWARATVGWAGSEVSDGAQVNDNPLIDVLDDRHGMAVTTTVGVHGMYFRYFGLDLRLHVGYQRYAEDAERPVASALTVGASASLVLKALVPKWWDASRLQALNRK